MQHGYLELKLSWELFQKAPETLSAPERERLTKVASRQKVIERHILASAEGANVIVPAITLRTRLAEIRQRYPSEAEFVHNLERIGLKEADLEDAVERDIRVEAVLEKVASTAPPVSLVDAEIYYHLKPAAFDRPEARQLRHILITFDTVKSRAKAAAQLEALRATLNDGENSVENFAKAALRHSQCPTALEGGLLGVVKRKQLYAELEPAAFALHTGQISGLLESPIGLHIVRCDEILPSGLLPFSEVCTRIVERLTDKRRRDAQREWMKSLLAG